MRRFETFSLHNLVEKIRIKSITWLSLPKSKEFARIPLSDMQKRKNMFYEFLYWVINGFVIPLLRTTFYVTETGPFKNIIL